MRPKKIIELFKMLFAFFMNVQILCGLGVLASTTAASHGVKDTKLLSPRNDGQTNDFLDIATYNRKPRFSHNLS